MQVSESVRARRIATLALLSSTLRPEVDSSLIKQWARLRIDGQQRKRDGSWIARYDASGMQVRLVDANDVAALRIVVAVSVAPEGDVFVAGRR